ncbi:hypothetical protein [Ekhidna sp.]|uniref:hypothetical protein n=1 Tax=Ekhidna sp. TaxID=2608089 RepID=UPI003C7C23BE
MKKLKSIFTLILVSALLLSCGDDDGASISLETGTEVSFNLFDVTGGGVLGTATFAELSDGTTKVTIDIASSLLVGDHPIHIHENTAAEGGDIAVTLNPVDASGMSETTVETLDDGTSISYNELVTFDGYINVHLSAAELATLVAQGDIGVNAFTGESMSYDLNEADLVGISGTAIFEERVSGETLVTLMLENTPDGGSHPSHIHMNTAAEGGDIAVTLESVNGTSGMSKTNVSALDDGTMISYNELIDYDGYINVHASADDLATLAAQGDIGQNVLTGMSETYDLNEVDVAGVSGTVTFSQRVNDEILVTIQLMGTTQGDSHPTHIHFNSAAEGGDIAVTLTSVDGTTGMSQTNVSALNDMTSLTYNALITFDGYINVHQSTDDLATLIAQGDIGANAGM